VRQALLFRGTVNDAGAFSADDRFRWLAVLQIMKGKRVEVTLRRERRFRSLKANRFYWGWVLPILAEYTGYSAEELHEALKQKILGTKDTPFGPIPKSTREMDDTQFSDYVHHVQAEAAQLGCAIPNPEDVA